MRQLRTPQKPSLMLATILSVCCLVLVQNIQAHHVLGRPSYSLSEDSTTPPSAQVETQLGDYFITFMAFPAFPKPNEPGRVNLYASRIDNGESFQGKITFKVRKAGWFSSKEQVLGVQDVDDNVYRQGFEFHADGDYSIIAEFKSGGEPYSLEFPLRIGSPAMISPLGISIAVVIVLLMTVNVVNRKRLRRLKVRRHHQDANPVNES